MDSEDDSSQINFNESLSCSSEEITPRGSIFDRMSLAEVEEALIEKPYNFLNALVHFSNFNSEFWLPLMQSCFYAFNKVDEVPEMISFVVQNEIKNTKIITSLFREDSVAIRIVRFYFNEAGSNYLEKSLKNIMTKIIKGKKGTPVDFSNSILKRLLDHINLIPMFV